MSTLSDTHSENDSFLLNADGDSSDVFYLKLPARASLQSFSLTLTPQTGAQRFYSPQDFVFFNGSLYVLDSLNKRLYRLNVSDMAQPKILTYSLGSYPHLFTLSGLLSVENSSIVLTDPALKRSFFLDEELSSSFSAKSYDFAPLKEEVFGAYEVVLDSDASSVKFYDSITQELVYEITGKTNLTNFKYLSSFEIYTVGVTDYLTLLDARTDELIVFTKPSSQNVSFFTYQLSINTFASDSVRLNSVFDLKYYDHDLFLSDSYNDRILRINAETFNLFETISMKRPKGLEVFEVNGTKYLVSGSYFDKIKIFFESGSFHSFSNISSLGSYYPVNPYIDVGDDYKNNEGAFLANYVEYINNNGTITYGLFVNASSSQTLVDNLTNSTVGLIVNNSKFILAANKYLSSCVPQTWKYKDLVSRSYSVDFSKLYGFGIVSDYQEIEDYCYVPIRVYSNSPGMFLVSNGNFSYSYTLSLSDYRNEFNHLLESSDPSFHLVNEGNGSVDVNFSVRTEYVSQFQTVSSQALNSSDFSLI